MADRGQESGIPAHLWHGRSGNGVDGEKKKEKELEMETMPDRIHCPKFMATAAAQTTVTTKRTTLAVRPTANPVQDQQKTLSVVAPTRHHPYFGRGDIYKNLVCSTPQPRGLTF